MKTWLATSTPVTPAKAALPQTAHPPKGKGKGKGAGAPPGKRSRSEVHTGGLANLRTLAVATAELSLQSAKHIRLLSSIAIVTLLVPKHPVVESAAAVEQFGDAGEPDIRRWAILVSTLADEQKLPGDIRQVLSEHVNEVSSPEQLQDVVHICHCAPTSNDQSMFKVQLQVTTALERVAKAVVAACVVLGATVKYGPAPRTAAERLVASSLKQA
ncbi:unnamed protein product [Polarella glacialis]|uniref:Uncharacterized protein n=1 Tax=Polarella glacialis TaxID=89957 RepID=A0A813HGG5_POLGL|nr:unnamed protein product [Polarella glacialis]CAE8719235.1 unnamed protein product [Polarella glacialis]